MKRYTSVSYLDLSEQKNVDLSTSKRKVIFLLKVKKGFEKISMQITCAKTERVRSI